MATRTHSALVTVGARKPFELWQNPTIAPEGNEILIRQGWTASTPLDMHRADGGLLTRRGQVMGAVTVGVVKELGPDVGRFKAGDEVFGWAFQDDKSSAHQEYVTAPEWMFAKIPSGFSKQQVATVPENFITVFNTMSADLELPTPWPKPSGYVPPRAEDPILIWGAASSVGQFALQILKYYGYRHLIATASPTHHEYLRQLGATEVYNYREENITQALLDAAAKIRGGVKPAIPLIIDCIGSLEGSLEPVSKVAENGTTVAIMLPVILKHSSEDQIPEFTMDATTARQWPAGVNVRGVRTHYVYNNQLFREKLATEIMPSLLSEGVVTPQRYRVIEGATLQERATKAVDELRKGVSGEKLVWRVTED